MADPVHNVENATAPDVFDAQPTRRGRWASWIALLALASLVLLAAAFGTRFGTDPTVVDSPLIGQPVPGLTLPYLEKPGSVSLRDLEGEIVVNFWASWCVPCREEHPDLVAAAEAYRAADVTFVGIVFQDREDSAIAFLDELGRGYDHLVDPGSAAAIDFGVFGVPETYFIDRDGTVVAKITGKSTFELLSTTLDAILAGKRPQSVTAGDVQSQPGG